MSGRSCRATLVGLAIALAAVVGDGRAARVQAPVVKDCRDACPEMVLVPAGRFKMGSPDDEAGRDVQESPRHDVRIGRRFLVGRYDVTVEQFAKFVSETRYDTGDRCDDKPGVSWKDPGFPQVAASPVVCVDYADAAAYLAWLSRKTGHTYRLLSEAEYEYVNRAGTSTPFWWGGDVGAGHANCKACGSAWDNRRTSPVGSFAPNPFGLYDTTGDVYVWVSDCWTGTYDNAPADGAPNLSGDCTKRGLRGGGWGSPVNHVRAAFRLADPVGNRYDNMGFRVARDL
jgi:formylglycine-generating enzyme required for sulfatase activity